MKETSMYRGKDGNWYWHTKSGIEGKPDIIADGSEGYVRAIDCVNGWRSTQNLEPLDNLPPNLPKNHDGELVLATDREPQDEKK
jgi:hypothetical protein